MLRIVSAIMAVLFAISVYVQLDDPDWYLWLLIYGFALAVTLMAVFARYSLLAVPGVVGYLGGFFYRMPSTFDGWYTNELAREALGLLFCGVWMIVLSVKVFRDLQDREAAAEAESTAD
jgi:hypothetical protein